MDQGFDPKARTGLRLGQRRRGRDQRQTQDD
jgi:hypothetical protein